MTRRTGMQRRRSDRVAITTVVTLALVLLISGFTWALVRDRTPTDRTAPKPVATVTPSEVPTETPSREPGERRTPSPTVEPTAEPTPVDPYGLADGTYPTYMRKVVVEASTVRVDVIQVYLGDAARREARKDGMSWKDSRYLGLYLRNENPMLRTLPVAGDARIEFVGGCVAEDTLVGLRDLYRASTPFDDAFYYDLVVEGGVVTDITQHYTVEGC
jgi:hypothetical protein